MKILYAIQGTGNGHITRSSAIINELKKQAEVDVLVSGIHNELKSNLNVNYNLRGLGFVFGQSGGVDYLQTFKQNKLKTLFNEIKNLPVQKYNLVVSDFEPVSVWAASRAGVPSIGISNQASILHAKVKKPGPFLTFNRIFMENYALCNHHIGLHFESVDEYIETPVIRDEIREGSRSDEGYGLVYLPFYSDEIIFETLKHLTQIPWIVFSKHSKVAYRKGHIKFEPVNGPMFNSSLLNCHIVITAAGFGTTSEALHLGKKMVVIPMKNQFEQKFNAYTLKKFGVKTVKSFLSLDAVSIISDAIENAGPKSMNYPNNTKSICTKLFKLYNGPIFDQFYPKIQQIEQPLDYYLNPPIYRDSSGTLSY